MLALDQFPCNAFRGTTHMYPRALAFAEAAIAAEHDRSVA